MDASAHIPRAVQVRDSTILGCQCGVELSQYLARERGMHCGADKVETQKGLFGDMNLGVENG